MDFIKAVVRWLLSASRTDGDLHIFLVLTDENWHSRNSVHWQWQADKCVKGFVHSVMCSSTAGKRLDSLPAQHCSPSAMMYVCGSYIFFLPLNRLVLCISLFSDVCYRQTCRVLHFFMSFSSPWVSSNIFTITFSSVTLGLMSVLPVRFHYVP